MTDFLFNMPPGGKVYDIETYPNIFTACFIDALWDREWQFEISPWRNDINELCLFMDMLRQSGAEGIGFNNLSFDYPVLHFIYHNQRACISALDIYNKAMSIINAPFQNRFAHIIVDRDWETKGY